MGFVYFGRPWRMVRRGGLRPLVLRIISNSPKNGAEIMDEIEKFTWGWWRPSPGSVYPLLEEMVNEGLVTKRSDGRYEITDKGRQELEWPLFPKLHHMQAGSIDDMLNEINGELQYFEDLKSSDSKKLEPYLGKLKQIDEVIVVDSNASRLEELKKKAKQRLPDSLSAKLSTHKCDIISNKEELLKILKRSDVAIGALPHSVADIAVASAIEAAINYVDLIYSWRASNSYADVDKKAKNENITIIPACGLAPGLSNIIARKAVEDIRGEADELTIYVGGIPEKPEPPLEYKIVFSPDSVIEEYTREALVVRNGKIAMLPALSEVEEVTFTSVSGKFEAFVTDGLSTLPNTVKAFNMTEKTVRWIGHAEKIRMLSELGLFSEEEIDIGDKCKISPRKVMSRLLADRLAMKGEDRDMTLLKVVAKK